MNKGDFKMCKKIEISEVEYKDLKLIEQEYRLLIVQMDILKKQNEKLISENYNLRENIPIQRKHNERGAGRKTKFNGEVIQYVLELKGLGWDYVFIKSKVLEKFNQSISIGTISNIIKNNW